MKLRMNIYCSALIENVSEIDRQKIFFNHLKAIACKEHLVPEMEGL